MGKKFNKLVLDEIPEYPSGISLPIIAIRLNLVDLKGDTAVKSRSLRMAEKKVLHAIDSLSFTHPLMERTIPVQPATQDALRKVGITKSGNLQYFSMIADDNEEETFWNDEAD